MVDGITRAFENGQKIKLKNRGVNSGITYELKSVFDELAKKGVIKDKDGKGLTRRDALNLYNTLNKIHQETNRATNYTKMQVGQSFEYTAEEMKMLAQAAGYEVVAQTPSEDVPIYGGMLPEVVVTAENLKSKEDVSELNMPVETEIDENTSLDRDLNDTDNLIKDIVGKTFEREVNGEQQKISVVKVDGKKIRRVINDDGSFGEKLIAVSTVGKNKYVTESKFNSDVKRMLGLGEDDEIPSELKAEYVTIGDVSSIVIKKDGRVMDSSQIRAFMADYKD